MQTTQTIEQRLQRLEDIETLRQLKFRYCAYCDAGYDGILLAPLFTDDAVWDGGPLGYAAGRKAIFDFFASCSKLIPFAIHHVTNPIIEIAGDLATGEWLLWEPMVFARGERATWMAARYYDVYRRVDGKWKFAHVKIDVRMLSPYEEGFAKVRVAELQR